MIDADRRLLSRLRRINASVGEIVLALMDTDNNVGLHADGLRDVGQALRTLGADMIARADEIDATPTIEGTAE